MRAVLALLLVLTSGQAFAACKIPLEGNWTVTAGSQACTVYLNAKGKGEATCMDFTDATPHTFKLDLSLSIGPDCHFTGALGPSYLSGRVVQASVFAGIAWNLGALMIYR